MLFHYIRRILYVATAGKALSGWKDPLQPVFTATVRAFVTPTTQPTYEKFARELFRHTMIDVLHKPEGLMLFRDALIASLLMYLRNFHNFVGDDDIVISKIRGSAAMVGISWATLLQWGEYVHDRFESDNISQVMDSAEYPEVVDALQAQATKIRRLSDDIAESNSRVQMINAQLKQMEKTMKENQERSDNNFKR